MKYVAPHRGTKAFTCPYCGVLARQYHHSGPPELDGGYTYTYKHPIASIICEHCKNFSLWHFDSMVFPNRGNAPMPNSDMPVEVKKDYEEAASISTQSPGGAAALLRLSIQKLCVCLGGSGKNINKDIETLVKNGLPANVQKALDVVRVIGNNAVHPGQIDADDVKTVGKLFSLVNVIVEYMISMPQKISGLYDSLPNGAKKAIERRDGKTAT